MAPPILPGTLVEVTPETRSGRPNSEGGVGVVKKKKRRKTTSSQGSDGTTNRSSSEHVVVVSLSQDSNASGDSLYDICYTVSGNLSQDVDRSRVRHSTVFSTTARCRNEEDKKHPRPSIISSSHVPLPKNDMTTTKPTLHSLRQSSSTAPVKYSYAHLISSANQSYRGMSSIIYFLLQKKRKAKPGWLRKIESPGRDHRQQLTDVEKKKAMDLLLAAKPDERAKALVAHAWGRTPQAIGYLERKMLSSPDASVQRTRRSDFGENIWTSEKRRQSVYTAKFVFNKMIRQKYPDEVLTQEQINHEWEMADGKTIDECAQIAADWVRRGPFLLSEIARALQATRGSISWQCLATLVSGAGNVEIMCANTIRKFIRSLPDTTIQSTKLLPKLDAANILRRLWWAQQFWLFWQGAVTFNKKQVVLVHMDEKWFWSIVVRRNLKCVPYMCVEPVQHGVQHKSHLGKIMGIASTAFAPYNNDMSAGGCAFLVSLTRVGKMMKSKRDTYRRVYNDDGTYTYPSIRKNLLRVKGQNYFKGLEISGSKRGTAKDPKFDLMSWFRDVEIPKLEDICRRVEKETGKVAIVRYQMDCAGPHKDKTLNEFLNDEFSCRNWMLKFQPSNSPVTNVKDDCIFPAISKHVTREQGISKGSQIYSKDELWASVEQCWQSFPLNTISRAYVRHAQIASALISCDGGDEFVRERGGLHYNVRRCCVTVCDNNGKPTGVEVVSIPDDEDDEVNNEQQPQLQYPIPDVGDSLDENLRRMTDGEIDCLSDGLPKEHDWFKPVRTAMAERGLDAKNS